MSRQSWKSVLAAVVAAGLFAAPLLAQQPASPMALPAGTAEPKFPKATGVANPALRHSMTELKPTATFAVEGHPDWMAVTDDAVWVASSNKNHVVRLDPKTNLPGAVIPVAKPCSGLALGFGSLWIPSCGDHSLVRADQETGAIQATVPAGPADSEGGIATGAGSVWLVVSKASELDRIDPATNSVVAKIVLPPGTVNPIFANGLVWVASNSGNALVRVDPATDTVTGSTPTGLAPRFLTAGAGSVWTLNQGDGTISRVDATTGKLLVNIPAGLPGLGGEIAFGAGQVWATLFDFPITQVDPATNSVVGQWRGAGGDSIRYGFGTIWLTSYIGAKVWRLDLPK